MSYRLEVGLALLLAGAIGVAVFAATRTPKPAERDARASTLLSGPEGSQALYRVLVRLGRRVERRRTPLFALAADTAPRLLVVLDPPLPLEDAELEQVVGFVQHGGAVLAAAHGGGILECAGWRLQPGRLVDDSVALRAPRGGEGLRLPRAARVLAPRARARGLQGLTKRSSAEIAPEESCGTLVAKAADTLVAAANGRPVVLRLHYTGGGSITLASDVGWFRNQVWRDTDVPSVVVPLLFIHQARRGRVVWDEYHQGFGRESRGIAALTWDWTLHSPAGWAILQLVAVGLVWLAVTAVRFGPARSVIERRRRSPLEHLEALGAGLESAADSGTAVRRIVAGLRRRLSRTGHVGHADLKGWLETLELATTSTRGRGAVRRLRHLITQRGGAAPERALDAAQAVEDVWEELRPRRTRDAF
jgi:hypothetical protein